MVRTARTAAEQLTVVRETAGEAVVVSVDGEVDAFTLHLLEAELAASLQASVVVVDLSEVSFLGSCGISALMSHHQRLAGLGSAVRLVVPPHQPVERALRITGITEELPVFASRPDALRAAG
jgi:anti-sigma B factor antagonist